MPRNVSYVIISDHHKCLPLGNFSLQNIQHDDLFFKLSPKRFAHRNVIASVWLSSFLHRFQDPFHTAIVTLLLLFGQSWKLSTFSQRCLRKIRTVVTVHIYSHKLRDYIYSPKEREKTERRCASESRPFSQNLLSLSWGLMWRRRKVKFRHPPLRGRLPESLCRHFQPLWGPPGALL